MSFKAKLFWASPKPTKSFMPKVRRQTAERALNIAEAIWTGAVNGTPVNSGELRASWNLSRGKPDLSVVGKINGSSANTSPLAAPTMPKLKAGALTSAKFYVTNGKEYGPLVEFGSPTNVPRLMFTQAIRSVEF